MNTNIILLQKKEAEVTLLEYGNCVFSSFLLHMLSALSIDYFPALFSCMQFL